MASPSSTSPELLAITKNSANLCNGITKASTVTAFSLLLEERGFITSDAKNSILRTAGISPQQQFTMFLDAVTEQVRIDPTKFESFVGIFRCEAALSFYADLMIKTHEIETAKLHPTTPTKHHDPPKPEQSSYGVHRASVEYGIMISELILILEHSNDSLNNMQNAFYHMAQYEDKKVYIDIVQSTQYKTTNSVQSLFELLGPYLKSPDCSLLKALVKAAKCEAAMERLAEYLGISTNVNLVKHSPTSSVPENPSVEPAPVPESEAVGSAPILTRPVVSSEPISNSSTVPVTATVAVDEMSWGMLRGIQSLLCGVFRVPPFSLQYNCVESGSVTIKWATSRKIASHVRSIVLDDGDLKLLLKENIVSIQVGIAYTVTTGNKEYWERKMALETMKEGYLPHPSRVVSVVDNVTAESTDGDIKLPGHFDYQNVSIHKSDILGEGSFGTVYKAAIGHTPCAAKVLHPFFTRGSLSNFSAQFDQECAILQKLRHPCIVQFLGVVQDPTECSSILLLELMDETLTHFLERSKTSVPYRTQLKITYDIALALEYLHLNNIIHRDLSSNNILLKGDTHAKVSDFGLLKVVENNNRMTLSKVTQCPGTPPFMPPEARRSKPRYSDKLDIFSFGVLIVQIITRTFPAPTEAEIVIEDDSEPTGERIILVPEKERRKDDIAKVPSDHALLPIALDCLKDRDRERPTAAQLCRRLVPLKTAQHYKKDEKALYDAATRGDVSAVRQLMSSNVNIDCTPYQDGWTPLMTASFQGHVDIVKILIEDKAQINAQQENGFTALHLAEVDVVRLLIQAQAQVNIQTKDGFTALHLAAQEGKVDIVRLLTEAQAQVNIQTEDDRTALYIASWKGHAAVVKLLLQQHANINIFQKNGWTSLMAASFEGHADIVKILIEAKAEINKQDEISRTALHLAAQEGKVDVVRLLTEVQAQEQWKKMREELNTLREREKRLQDQRDMLQSREEIMDLQLKQYMSDFEEERTAREKMTKVGEDSSVQIKQLRRQVNDLSTEKNDLVIQNEQHQQQLQQLQQK